MLTIESDAEQDDTQLEIRWYVSSQQECVAITGSEETDSNDIVVHENFIQFFLIAGQKCAILCGRHTLTRDAVLELEKVFADCLSNINAAMKFVLFFSVEE